MINQLKSVEKDGVYLSEIISSVKSNDFYFTLNNKRIVINDLSKLKQLLKESYNTFYECSENKKGIVMIWKSFGGNKERCYVKILADSPQTARDLLTVLLWDYKKDLYVKLRRNSEFFPIFIEKGFEFRGGRGLEVLLITNEAIREKLRRPKNVQ